jgi:glycosyltransferase involved in cell wall biosynthesis
MRIAIVYPSLRSVGGAENVVIWLAESLVQRGHTVVVFTKEFSEDLWGKFIDRPYSVHLLDFKKYRSTLTTNREAGLALSKALASYEFDVVNPHNYPASLWVYYAKTQSYEFPKVLLYMHNLTRNFYAKKIDIHLRKLSGFRNIWNRYRPKTMFRYLRQSLLGYKRLDKAAVESCDSVLANSMYAANLAKNIYGREVQFCPLGVPIKLFKNQIADTYQKRNKTSQLFIVLTVARIETQKNIDTILKAVRVLKKQNKLTKDFVYKIAGDGPQLAYFKRKSKKMGLNDTVHFLGPIPHNDVWKLYAESDIIVHVPLDEPFGLVPVEAALFRKPSIVSDHGGPSEIVVDGLTGLHVRALSPEDLADKIQNLMEQPHRLETMGEAAHIRMAEHYEWDVFVKKFELELCKLNY